MVNSFEIIKTIEEIYKKTNILETIKKQKAKQKIKLLVFPIIVSFILFCALLFFSIYNKNQIIQFIMSICFVVSIFWILHSHKSFLKKQYGIYDENDEVFFYNIFKKNILDHEISKELLLKAKDILLLETKEEQNHLTIYFIGYSSLVLIPTMFISFEEYIKTYIQVPLYVIFMAFLFPIMMYIMKDMFFNRKEHIKKTILRNIERMIIEM